MMKQVPGTSPGEDSENSFSCVDRMLAERKTRDDQKTRIGHGGNTTPWEILDVKAAVSAAGKAALAAEKAAASGEAADLAGISGPEKCTMQHAASAGRSAKCHSSRQPGGRYSAATAGANGESSDSSYSKKF